MTGAVTAAAVADALERLKTEQRRHPERSALFPHLGDASVRRQILRWMARDQARSSPAIDQVLRAALADPDWEVRMTAVIAAARLRAASVLPDVARTELPRTRDEGFDRDDRRILELLRRASMAALADAQPDHLTATGVDPIVADRLVALVRDHNTHVEDRISLLVHALAEPIDCGRIRPPDTDGIVRDEDAYRTIRSGIRLRWITPVPHIVVDDLRSPAPVRIIAPAAGFYMSERLLDTGAHTASEAIAAVRTIATEEGVRAAIPTRDEWSMAALGPDGRRFPWGNGAELADAASSSPWGVQQVTAAEQWIAIEGGGMAIARGDRLGRGPIAPADPTSRAGVRLVIRLA
jgi:hypothetical protein